MAKFLGPQDIYKELVEDVPENENWLLGLVAFAVVEEQKIEWIKHQLENNGAIPTSDEIEKWYAQLPQGALIRAKDTAQSRLTDYGQSSIDEYVSEFRKEIEEGLIVSEIRESKKFWPQFGVNLAGGFASSVLITALLTSLAFMLFNDTSESELASKLKHKLEVNAHGEERSNK
ncbi:MAG: hypothetical protein EOO52_15145 [Gammaproteobacteria bacterium]|nr:MAG: hypothetical protein EOO52_15145 [Gammaproteobacteria bacterium]